MANFIIPILFVAVIAFNIWNLIILKKENSLRLNKLEKLNKQTFTADVVEKISCFGMSIRMWTCSVEIYEEYILIRNLLRPKFIGSYLVVKKRHQELSDLRNSIIISECFYLDKNSLKIKGNINRVFGACKISLKISAKKELLEKINEFNKKAAKNNL